MLVATLPLQGPKLPRLLCSRCQLSYQPGYYCYPRTGPGCCQPCLWAGFYPIQLPTLIAVAY